MALIMHAGMEGPHLFRIMVPITTSEPLGGDLELYIRADFR